MGTSPGAGDIDPTEVLWGLRVPASAPIDHGVLLSGVDRTLIEAASCVDAALSGEAGDALAAMSRIDRMLTSAQRVRTETCINSVRGPISWSETMTARANALGNEDVFVCLTSERTLDTAENRLVAHCLGQILRARSSLDVVGDSVFDAVERRILDGRSGVAESWLQMAVLSTVPRRPPSQRELQRLRRGRRAGELAPLLHFVERERSGATGPLLSRLIDGPTRSLHAFMVEVLDLVRRYEDLPKLMSVKGGVLVCGRFTFRHPAHPGPGIPGMSFRGVPLIPPVAVLEGASWSPDLPSNGRRLGSIADLEGIMAEMGLEPSG